MNKTTNQLSWPIVLKTELRRIWTGWRGPLLLFVFSLFLSIYIFLLALDPEVNVLSQRKMIELSVQVSILIGIVSVLTLGADSFSGERDQRTLESLLLTSAPRSQLVIGKLLAILSIWLGMLPIAIPYVALVANGTDVVLATIFMLLIPGTLLVCLSAGVGVIVSALSPTNLISFAISFLIMLPLAATTQLPGSVQDLPAVHWFIVSNPITATTTYLSAVVDGELWTNGLTLLLSPLLILLLVVILGPRYLNRRLSLPGGFK